MARLATRTRDVGDSRPPRFLLGLDLGQASDYTAISVLEQVEAPVGEPSVLSERKADFKWMRHASDYDGVRYNTVKRTVQEVEARYHLRHLERPQLGTPYPAIVERVRAIASAPDLAGRTTVIVDATGVGRPVLDMLTAARVDPLVGVTIHGGDAVTRDGQHYRVPKRELAAVVQALLQTERLKFAGRLPLADVLRREMQAFKVKINVATGHDTYEAWREGDHDDLVLSLACACWYGEYVPVIDYAHGAF